MNAVLRVENLGVMRGERAVVDGVSFDVEPGRVLAVVGPNGAGKSSLLSTMMGLLEPARGQVLLDGQPLSSIPPRARARRIAGLGQDERPDDELTAIDVVLLGRAPHLGPWGLPSESDVELARDALRRTDALTFESRALRTLSGGERQRVLLARVLCQAGAALLLDEPTHALDPGQALHIMQLVQKESRGGAAVVVVLHDLSLAARCSDALLVLHAGRPVFHGSWQELRPDILERAFGTPFVVEEVRGTPVVIAAG